MAALTPKEFQRLCKAGQLRGAYFFFGPEEYLKIRSRQMLRSRLFPEDDPFNHIKISADEGDYWEALQDAALSLPMFAEKKLVELHALDYGKLSVKETERLTDLLQELSQQEETILLLYATPAEFDPGVLPKRPSASYKNFEKAAGMVCFSYESPAELENWVHRHFAAQGLEIAPPAVKELIAYCSEDMFALSGEIEKLSYYTLDQGRKTVEARDIRFVCCGRNIEGNFDFTNALMHGDGFTALELLSAMKRRKEKAENVLGAVVDVLSGMYAVRTLAETGLDDKAIAARTGLNEYRVKLFRNSSRQKSVKRLEKAMELCMEADLAVKSSPQNNYVLLDRLVLRLCRV